MIVQAGSDPARGGETVRLVTTSSCFAYPCRGARRLLGRMHIPGRRSSENLGEGACLKPLPGFPTLVAYTSCPLLYSRTLPVLVYVSYGHSSASNRAFHALEEAGWSVVSRDTNVSLSAYRQDSAAFYRIWCDHSQPPDSTPGTELGGSARGY